MKSLCPMALYRNAFLKSRKNKYHFVDLRVWSLPPTKSLQPLKKTLVLKSRVFLSNWTDLYFVPAYCDGVPVVCGEGDGEKGHVDQAEDGGKRQGQRTTETHPPFSYYNYCLNEPYFTVHTTYCLKHTGSPQNAPTTVWQYFLLSLMGPHRKEVVLGRKGSRAAQKWWFQRGVWGSTVVPPLCETLLRGPSKVLMPGDKGDDLHR